VGLQLAGMKIYLVSRNEAKLRETASAIEHKYLVETKYYVADLVDAGAPTHDESCWFGLKTNLESLDVGVLINNAGLSYVHPEYLHELDPGSVASIVSINCSAVAKMAQVVLPGMVSRKRGCIINISSGVAALPACPLLAVYAASKAFVINLTYALAEEYAQHGIAIQVGFSVVRRSTYCRLSSWRATCGRQTRSTSGLPFWACPCLPASALAFILMS
jgi:17beta-estradiol 17-dehydrogenase / very-long-chain 3-oxoacyl-CoA reductase